MDTEFGMSLITALLETVVFGLMLFIAQTVISSAFDRGKEKRELRVKAVNDLLGFAEGLYKQADELMKFAVNGLILNDNPNQDSIIVH